MSQYLNQEHMARLFDLEGKDAKLYRKAGRVIARYAEAGETILTIVGGKLETLNTASFGDVVVRNVLIGSAAEQYVMTGETFAKRYKPWPEAIMRLDGFGWIKAEAIGEVFGFVYTGPALKFEAPWGEEMMLEPTDFLVRVGAGDIYRIEAAAFAQTYALVEAAVSA